MSDQPTTTAPALQATPVSKSTRAFLRWGRLCAVASFGLILATELAGRHWPVAGATAYLPQLAFLGFAGVVLLALAMWRVGRLGRVDRVLVVVSGVAGLYGASVTYDLVPWRVIPAADISPDASGPQITVLYANVHTSNTDHAKLLDLIRRTDPDVVLLVELNSAWVRSLESLYRDYPHRRVVPDDAGNFGMGFWTRLDVERAEFVLLKPEQPGTLYDTPQIEATMRVRDGDGTRAIRLLGLHPLPPLSPGNLAARDAVLRGARASADHQPVAATILLGDLNATRYCRIMQEIADGKYRDATASYRYSWPDRWSGWAMGIKLDHLLVDDSWAVVSVSMDDSIGSDHRPIVARLAIVK